MAGGGGRVDVSASVLIAGCLTRTAAAGGGGGGGGDGGGGGGGGSGGAAAGGDAGAGAGAGADYHYAYYNDMATLLFNPHESVAKQLLSRHTAGYFSVKVVLRWTPRDMCAAVVAWKPDTLSFTTSFYWKLLCVLTSSNRLLCDYFRLFSHQTLSIFIAIHLTGTCW